MSLFFFSQNELLVRKSGGPLHEFHYHWDLRFKSYWKEPETISKLTTALLGLGYSEAESQGAIGSYSFAYLGLVDLDVSDYMITSDRPLTDEEIEERTPVPEFKKMAYYKCPYGDAIDHEFPNHLSGYGPECQMINSRTRYIHFWVDPDQASAAQEHFEQKGWKQTSHWNTHNYTAEQKEAEAKEILSKLRGE